MLAGLPAQTFVRWIAYDQLDPFGGEREDLRMAIEASALCNMLRAKNTRRFKPADFLPRFDRTATQTAQDMHAKMMQFAMMFQAYEAGHGNH